MTDCTMHFANRSDRMTDCTVHFANRSDRMTDCTMQCRFERLGMPHDAHRSRYARCMYFHTRNLELADGMTVRLVSLNQEMYIERIWVGEPNTTDNARFLARVKDDGAYVVWAPEALTHSALDPYDRGIRAQLPPIMCTAFVESDNNLARLVWFQNDWAFPIAPDVLTALRTVDWKAVPQEVYI
jgi:hypothetical protein